MYEAAMLLGVWSEVPLQSKPWGSQEIEDLIIQRRLCVASAERSRIPRQIQKVSRTSLRKHNTTKAAKLHEKFTGLSELSNIEKCPVNSKANSEEIHPDVFAGALEEIYEDPNCNIQIDRNQIKDVPAFTLPELLWGFGKCETVEEQISHMWWSKL